MSVVTPATSQNHFSAVKGFGVFLFGVGFHWVSLTLATLLATAGHWALTRAAKYDPRLSRIYVRHVRYQSYYPARPPIAAPPAWVYPSVED